MSIWLIFKVDTYPSVDGSYRLLKGGPEVIFMFLKGLVWVTKRIHIHKKLAPTPQV